MNAKLLSLALLCLASTASAYTPGKWDPLDDLITGKINKTPRELRVYNQNGKLVQVAELEFANGRLATENYLTAENKPAGKTKYTFTKEAVIKEELFDAAGKRVSHKDIFYRGGLPEKIKMYDRDKLIQEIEFRYANNMLVEAREKHDGVEDIHQYIYKDNRLVGIHTRDESGAEFHRIEYSYDAKGRLIQRKRIFAGQQQTCKVEYNNGDLSSYSYFTFAKNEWQLEKKLAFSF
jgi:antitoxin component YwqK of YwqJK toxin-antitoxin module